MYSRGVKYELRRGGGTRATCPTNPPRGADPTIRRETRRASRPTIAGSRAGRPVGFDRKEDVVDKEVFPRRRGWFSLRSVGSAQSPELDCAGGTSSARLAPLVLRSAFGRRQDATPFAAGTRRAAFATGERRVASHRIRLRPTRLRCYPHPPVSAKRSQL